MDMSLFDVRYKNDETGCPAYDPKLLLKVVLFAYSRRIVGSRRIEWLCRNHVICMALACMQCPDHSTIVAFVSSMTDEILSVFCDILLVCEAQQLLGGTVFALDGVKLPSNASKEWSGTLQELQHKQEKLEAKLEQLLAEHQQRDRQRQCGEIPPAPSQVVDAQPAEGQCADMSSRAPQLDELQREESQSEEAPCEESQTMDGQAQPTAPQTEMRASDNPTRRKQTGRARRRKTSKSPTCRAGVGTASRRRVSSRNGLSG
jgi:transposase